MSNQKIKNQKITFPYRELFDSDDFNMIKKVFKRSKKNKKDFGYQDFFEKQYCNQFRDIQKKPNSYVDVVNSGSSALFISLKSLNLKKDSEVIVSPVTNPGSVTPILILSQKIVVIDSGKDNYNVTFDSFVKKCSSKTKAAILTHSSGIPINDIELISKYCKKNQIFLIEDCSQAHGAKFNSNCVGNFGDIACFSTMFSKMHSTGGTGGVVYSKNQKFSKLLFANADRGKNLNDKNDTNDARKFILPALNFNSSEIACAIGISSLKKLKNTIYLRKKIYEYLSKNLNQYRESIQFINYFDDNKFSSPYYLVIKITDNNLLKNKFKLCKYLIKNNININYDYSELVSEWKWIPKKQIRGSTPNAIKIRNQSFHLRFNERYQKKHLDFIIKIIKKGVDKFIY